MSKAFSQIDLDGHDLPPSPAPSSPRGGRNYAIATQLVYSEGNDQYNASSVPIYQVYQLLTRLSCTGTNSNSLQPSNSSLRRAVPPNMITPAAGTRPEPT